MFEKEYQILIIFRLNYDMILISFLHLIVYHKCVLAADLCCGLAVSVLNELRELQNMTQKGQKGYPSVPLLICIRKSYLIDLTWLNIRICQ